MSKIDCEIYGSAAETGTLISLINTISGRTKLLEEQKNY